jgi:hypothetical protein
MLFSVRVSYTDYFRDVWIQLYMYTLQRAVSEATIGVVLVTINILQYLLYLLYRLHTAILDRPPSSTATMEVQGPDTQ